jgi:hypothetical protein
VCEDALVRYFAIDYVVSLPVTDGEDYDAIVGIETAGIESSYINFVFR